MNKKQNYILIGITKCFATQALVCMSLLIYCSCDVGTSSCLASGKVQMAATSDSIKWGVYFHSFGDASINFHWTVPKGRDAYIKDSLPYLRVGDLMVYKDSLRASMVDSLGNLHDVILPGKQDLTIEYDNSIDYCWKFLIKVDARQIKVLHPQQFLKLDGNSFLTDSIPVKWSVIPIRKSILPGKWGWGHSHALVLDK